MIDSAGPVATSDKSKTYWASLPLEEFLPEAFQRIDRYYDHVRQRGWLALWRAMHKAAYAGWWSGGRLNEAGDNGKFTVMEANELGNLKTHVLNLITGQKSQPEAQARSLDSSAQQQTIIAQSLAETVGDKLHFDRKRQDVNEMGLLYGEGWSIPLWDFEAGDVYAAEMDEAGNVIPHYEGEQQLSAAHPLDVIRDSTRTEAGDDDWIILRRPVSRYDRLAQYPELADKLAGVPSYEQETQEGKRPRLLAPWAVTGTTGMAGDSDQIVEYVFMHRKTRAMPQGRLVHFFSDDVASYDVPLPYREIPLKRWSASDVPGTIFGYTMFFDVLAPQQALNMGVSAITTRMSNFSVPTLWGPDGCKLQLTQLGQGLATLEGGSVKPEMLDFASIPPELNTFVKMLRDFMATYTGINSVARGQAEGGVTAASALALLEARAIQFVMLAQKADIQWQRDTYNQILQNFQDFGDAEFVVRVAGEGNRSRAERFTKHDIAEVESFTINVGNPLQSTTAGRMQIVEGAKQLNIPMTMEQYWQVLSTGRLDAVTEGPQKELELIRAENEAISKGKQPPALINHKHPLHIQEHLIPLADPDLDPNGPIAAAGLAHIQEHEQLWQQATVERPALLMAVGIPPAPLPPPPPMMDPSMAGPPAPGATSATPPPGRGPAHPNIAGPMAAPPGAPPGVKVEQAQPAKNPMTGAPNAHPVVQ